MSDIAAIRERLHAVKQEITDVRSVINKSAFMAAPPAPGAGPVGPPQGGGQPMPPQPQGQLTPHPNDPNILIDQAGIPFDATSGQPIDPAILQQMPPPQQQGGPPPMDPSMQGGQPPMDPSMQGGQPPMDPSMQGGQPAEAMPPEAIAAAFEEIIGMLEEMADKVNSFSEGMAQVVDRMQDMEGDMAAIEKKLIETDAKQGAPSPTMVG